MGNTSEQLSFVFCGLAAGFLACQITKGFDYMCYNIPLFHPLIASSKGSAFRNNKISSEVMKKEHQKVFDQTIEICVSDIESVIAALEGGATSLELCCDRPQGGVTPSLALIEESVRLAKNSSHLVTINVLIRPRPGGFIYTDAEFELIIKDCLAAKEAGAHGVVVGFLLANGQIDFTRLRILRAITPDMILTFHRAFDVSRGDPIDDLMMLVEIGCDRLLTSGKASSAMSEEGSTVLKQLVHASAKLSSSKKQSDSLDDIIRGCDDIESKVSAPSQSMSLSAPVVPSVGDNEADGSFEMTSSVPNQVSEKVTDSGMFASLWARLSTPTEESKEAKANDCNSFILRNKTSNETEDISASVLEQAVHNVSISRSNSTICIVAAAGIAAKSGLHDFLNTTNVRAVHAGSSVCERKLEIFDEIIEVVQPQAQATIDGPIPVHMGSQVGASDTLAFSCAVSTKVSDLVSQCQNHWEQADLSDVQDETSRLLTDRILAEEFFAFLEVDVSSSVSDSVTGCVVSLNGAVEKMDAVDDEEEDYIQARAI